MKKSCIVMLLCICLFATVGSAVSKAQSGRTIKTKMDSVMARTVEVFNTAWEATKSGDSVTMKKLQDSGKIIMVPRDTACTYVRDEGDKWVVIKVKGRDGEWVTMKPVFKGFE